MCDWYDLIIDIRPRMEGQTAKNGKSYFTEIMYKIIISSNNDSHNITRDNDNHTNFL